VLRRGSSPARKTYGEDLLPVIRLHDLRRTHAPLLLADGVPVGVVSERLGHAGATITLTVYRHVMELRRERFGHDADPCL